jgi:hypothetical protein
VVTVMIETRLPGNVTAGAGGVELPPPVPPVEPPLPLEEPPVPLEEPPVTLLELPEFVIVTPLVVVELALEDELMQEGQVIVGKPPPALI